MEPEKRERLSDISLAMRIISRQFTEDMTILLNTPGELAARKAALHCSEFNRQISHYIKTVEASLKKI